MMHAKCCSLDQKPENIGTVYIIFKNCQKYFWETYKKNYKYTAATFRRVETIAVLKKRSLQSSRNITKLDSDVGILFSGGHTNIG